jgi:hypothetical protein
MSDKSSDDVTGRSICLSARISLIVFRREKYFELTFYSELQYKIHAEHTFSASLALNRMMKQKQCHEYLHELAYSAAIHSFLTFES